MLSTSALWPKSVEEKSSSTNSLTTGKVENAPYLHTKWEGKK
jgi:hypothetical protein